jgi:voltage-gated potassium channel
MSVELAPSSGKSVDQNEPRLDRWQRATAWPTIFASFLYIAAYVLPIYLYPVSHRDDVIYKIIQYSMWSLFIIDFIVQISLARDKKNYLKHEWIALVIVVFPFFRPVRAIRGVILIRQAAGRQKSITKSLPALLASIGALMVIIIGAAVLNAERFAPGATIKTPSDALWWALGTITTSGSGMDPVTNEGRALAAVLLIFGLGILASMTGLIAGWAVKQFKSDANLYEIENKGIHG